MLIPLDDLDDPRLADYRSLKATNLTRDGAVVHPAFAPKGGS